MRDDRAMHEWRFDHRNLLKIRDMGANQSGRMEKTFYGEEGRFRLLRAVRGERSSMFVWSCIEVRRIPYLFSDKIENKLERKLSC